MANTRKSAKRARQADARNARNQTVRSTTRSTVTKAISALKSQDIAQAKAAYTEAVRALSKAASKGAFPPGRAARKISRLTLLVKKALPGVVSSK